ncbi:serine--tRNA ligase [Phenylobacterium sp.]|jgi:seryl-tRNA synthetase|uniref:serine--tRNA ligase n=1 Tax=Phenylobacterium sp. TaxID=1871053 RepID=UPI002E316189|nr:serine--tRNA ligase [Phenylobacterium sp.]HEX3364558.1 serine--tRNA ligase [Phenylobacterium sp.]
MHDIRTLRENPEPYVKGWDAKGLSGSAQVAQILDLDTKLRTAQTGWQTAQAERNDASKKIGHAKAAKDETEAQRLMAQVEALKAKLDAEGEAEKAAAQALNDLLASLPNIPAPDVPPGADEHANVEVRRWGAPFAIARPRDHVDLGEGLGLMDFEAAARMSGARFVVLKGELARLERALGQFMLDVQTREHGYLEVSPPLMVRTEAMFGTGQMPKFGDDQFMAVPGLNTAESFRTAEGPIEALPDVRWLIPTAEVSLTNLVREQITAEEELPLRLTALTPSFRAEAGASGRDTRGMIRQHQFYKVELVSITTPDQSEAEHERMVGCAEAILKRLELPFRTMLLCAGDMGFGARKTYDLEVWLPSEGRYREISSCSNCGDFQARRMDARTKSAGEKGTRFVHTLNGSGLAVGRTLVALMENYQDEDGRIAIPQALHPYLPGLTHIGGKAA